MARIKSDTSNIAFNLIREKINKFELASEDTVSDIELSTEFGMSRTPVREAIQELERIGLVIKQRTKYIVAPITEKDVNEIIVTRAALEKCAVCTIIENGGITINQMTMLKSLETRITENLHNGDYLSSFAHDSEFHRTLVSFSGNTRLDKFMLNLSLQGERLRWLSILTPSRAESTIKEHGLILEALKMQMK
jgi:Transcriptional regulators